MSMTSWLILFSLSQVPTTTPGADGGTAPSRTAAGELPTRPAAMAPDVQALVERVQSFYEKTRDFTAEFHQDYAYAASKRSKSSSGTVTYQKPAQMRWEYLQPSPRTFVLSGERAYMYDPEAKLVTRAALASNQLSASVTFLWGQGKLAEEFAISRRPCADCDTVSPVHARRTTLLELVPFHPDPRFKKVLLEVDATTAQVVKSTVVDPDGSVNAISFINLKANGGVPEGSFRLAPPPGTQVQDFLLPDAGTR